MVCLVVIGPILAAAMSAAVPLSAADELLEAKEERAFREAVTLAAPSIVRIETVGGLDVVGELLASSGPTTGVVVGADGWIITSSFNFASKPSSIVVTTADGRRHPAEIVATDQVRMLSLLKVDASNLIPLPQAPRAEHVVGQWVLAMGQTYDQPFPNVSVGIISALGRIWGRAVQTDAKVSPANYGGPLVDVQGRGVGILVPLSPQESGTTAGVEWYDSGIGFAIPLDDVYSVLDRMKRGDVLRPGVMGVTFPDRSPIAGEAVIDRVRPASPAAEAGLQVGDVIVEADGQPVLRVPTLRHILGRRYAGDTLSLKVRRGDETLDVRLILAAELTSYERPLLGILPTRHALSDNPPAGVVIRLVLPDSPAAAAGLERRDRIVRINGDAVDSPAALGDVISRRRSGDVLLVEIVRAEQEQTVEVTLTTMTGALPASIASSSIPQPAADAPGLAVKTGRFVDSLAGAGDRSYWAYVPQGYNPDYTYGLVIWLHPPGDTMEADALSAWRVACEQRGLLLVGPTTSRPEGWTPADVGLIQDLVEELAERYAIDPARVVIHATSGGAQVAAAAAFRHRKTIRGVSLVSSLLRIPPPEADPAVPLQFHFAVDTGGVTEAPMRAAASGLERLAFPVTVDAYDPSAEEEFPAAAVESIARWIDALDRI